jgi:CspA family cold shock protein
LRDQNTKKSKMSRGIVKFYVEAKGFGFITDEETGNEIFVHVTGIQPAGRVIREGETVEFEVENGKKGPMAVNVRVI